jgi:hypothetical protein
MPKPPPASTRNPAFQSKLEPYGECRAKRWSYPRIAAALREEHGLSAAPSTIFSFVKVRAKRRHLYALPPSDDPRVIPSIQTNPQAEEFFSPPDPKPHENKRFMSCLVIMGACFAYGWWKLSRHYDQLVAAAFERILSVNEKNQETFTQLTKMNVPIRVVPVADNRKHIIPRKFALILDRAEGVSIEDTPEGKRAA